MYHPSKYNVLFECEENLIVFNTFSKEIARFERKEWSKVYEILSSSMYSSDFEGPIWDYCCKKGFLTETEDELNILKRQCVETVNNRWLQLTMMPTYCCNLSCIYCFQKHIPNSLMSDDVVERVASFVEHSIDQYDGLYVEWFGGEPLVIKDKLLKLHKQFHDCAVAHKKPYVARITTNGYELDVHTFKQLYDNNCFVYYVSVDGPKEIHDKQRPLKNGMGSFDKIFNNLVMIHNQITARNFRIEIRINNSSDTIGHMNEFFEMYKRELGDDHRFILVLDRVQDWGDKTKHIKDRLLNEKEIEDIGSLASKFGIQLANMSMATLTTQVCQAAKRNAYTIFFDGSIHKCQMAMEQEAFYDVGMIGRLTSDGLEIDREKESQWVNDEFLEMCYECVALPLCLGKKCVFTTNIKREPCENIRAKLISALKVQELSNINKIELYQGR